jgi:hypothetical protein
VDKCTPPRSVFRVRKPCDSPLETDVISHSSDGKVRDEEHVPSVHLVDQIDPLLHGTEMGIKQSEVDNGIT